MDGSSIQFVDLLEEVGTVEQNADREYFTIPHNITYTEEDRKVEIVAMPLDDYRFTCMIDYNSPVLGSQHAGINTIAEFKKEIASCRTFCFLHELEYQLSHNLIKGGDLNNAIVIVDKEVTKDELSHLAKLFNRKDIDVAPQGILNNMELRYQNEPARHKSIGYDWRFSFGWHALKRPHYGGNGPGHAANIAFAKKIKAAIKKEKNKKIQKVYDPSAKPLYDVVQIMDILPHPSTVLICR